MRYAVAFAVLYRWQWLFRDVQPSFTRHVLTMPGPCCGYHTPDAPAQRASRSVVRADRLGSYRILRSPPAGPTSVARRLDTVARSVLNGELCGDERNTFNRSHPRAQ